MSKELDIFEKYVLIPPLIEATAREIAENSTDRSKWEEIITRHFKAFPEIARRKDVLQAIAEHARRILNGKTPHN